ncbi:MAG: ABC transporter ATP-binding protein [Deltaproteobacteria bacterium]|nr:ABC transporter ATP-binding protein [Deltaproteobacteria bacterium]
MSNTAIKVENLSKRYRIGLKEEIHDTMVGAITDFVKRPLKNLQRLRRLSNFSENGNEPEDTIWALKDVSFEVKQGEVIGIIGRNGAGKSTLLKIISHITEPTSGSVTFNGRVSSLLEVGTGFHPELTGRENVYLNGTILGMSKTEIDRKFDEIVAFSEVERFLDTPVKRYSSGMKVRLAFAVAAHLEPEILLIDEVLAVGDAEFQKKCLGKMDSIADEGRTVLFVSHNMPVLQSLCPKAILLNDGAIVMQGDSSEVIDNYLEQDIRIGGEFVWEWSENELKKLEPLIPISFRVKNHEGTITDYYSSTHPINIDFSYRITKTVSNLRVGVTLNTMRGETVCVSYDRDILTQDDLYKKKPGIYQSKCIIPANLLNDQQYVLGILTGIKGAQKLYRERNILKITIDATDGIGAHWGGKRGGILRPNFQWETQFVE